MRNEWLALLFLPAFLIAAFATAEDLQLAQLGYTFAFPELT